MLRLHNSMWRCVSFHLLLWRMTIFYLMMPPGISLVNAQKKHSAIQPGVPDEIPLPHETPLVIYPGIPSGVPPEIFLGIS